MDKKITDFFTLNHKSYDEMTNEQRQVLDKFIDGIREAGLENRLLSVINPSFDVSDTPEGSQIREVFTTTMPKDLTDELNAIWIKIKGY